MSVDAELQVRLKLTSPVASYDRVLKAVHWTTLLLIAGAYAVVWASHAALTREQHTVLVQLHRSIGLTVFAVTLFRVAWRWRAVVPDLPADLPFAQKLAARGTEFLLYLLLLVQPVLGFLHSNARTVPVEFYFLTPVPALIGPDKLLAKQLIAAHDVIANLVLGLIALHAAAALFHHTIRRDDVLKAMLPRRR